MELKSARDAYGNALLNLGDDNRVVVSDADLSTSTQTSRFAKKYPARFFTVGCAEQNLIRVASGLAIAGKVAFASTYAIFSNRAWKQINPVPMKIIGVKDRFGESGKYEELLKKYCLTVANIVKSTSELMRMKG